MSEREEFSGHEIYFKPDKLSKEDIVRRQKDFNKLLRRLSPEQQGVVTELTSVFIEGNIYNEYRKDPEKIEGLSQGLQDIGLSRKQSRIILRYLNLAVI